MHVRPRYVAMKKSGLQKVLRIIGILFLTVAGSFCLLLLLGGEFGLFLRFAILTLVALYLIRGAPLVLRVVDAFPKVTSQYEGDQAFTQVGGARWGRSYWRSANCTLPFAKLRVSKEALVVTISVSGLTFSLARSSIRRLRWKRALFSQGLQIEHAVGGLPPFILFWASNREALTQGLRRFGYEISDT